MNDFSKQVYKMWMSAFWSKVNQYLDDLNLPEQDKTKIVKKIRDNTKEY